MPFDIGSQTVLDLASIDAVNTRKMRDDSRSHHIIEDAMFMPRKRVSLRCQDGVIGEMLRVTYDTLRRLKLSKLMVGLMINLVSHA